MELCYRNNPDSLFRKYNRLVTWFSNTKLGKDYLGINKVDEKIGLFLPNGYHKILGRQYDKIYYESTIYTKPKYANKLYLALQAIDLASNWITDFKEAQHLLMWWTGQTLRTPRLAAAVNFTTTTVYPDANPETTSMDAVAANRPAAAEAWATIHDATSGTVDGTADDAIDTNCPSVNENGTNWTRMHRLITLFDTSSIPDTDTISSATYSLYCVNAGNNGHTMNVDMVTCAPASNTAVALGDYNKALWGTTLQATSISVGSFGANAYTDFTLNATGLGNISKTAITKFGCRISADTNDVEPTKATVYTSINVQHADTAGTANDPKLVVVHSAAAAAAKLFALLGVG